MKLLKYAHSFEVVAELPEALKPLRELALNFRWSWHHPTWELFEDLEPKIWEEVGHNPLELITRLTPDRVAKLLQDKVFLAKLATCHQDLIDYLGAETWFDRQYPGERDATTIAYFCAEFGINESLPIYSGGLGILAGDHLKAASDLGIPLIGMGLLYARGYFRQSLSPDGWQQEKYPNYDFFRMPLQLLRDEAGDPLRVRVEFPDRMITCHLWKAAVGRVTLYLLDSNVLENSPQDQTITDTLYGGDEHIRLRQEMILGIGGMRALKLLGHKPTVCHMNEGHAAFLSLERLSQIIADEGCDFRTARQAMVAGNVFTTHTPVPAGFDLFRPELLQQYLAKEIQRLGISFEEFLRLGRFNPSNTNEDVNMAVLAMENANHVNGVSRLHAQVSQGMFQPRWPDIPKEEVPIEAITNGIHTGTWMSRDMVKLFDRTFGDQWQMNMSEAEAWARVDELDDRALWELRENLRGDLIRFCRRRLVRSLTQKNASKTDISNASSLLDPRLLTIGFARRFATYKRASLLLSDAERLKSILNHPTRPVQFVFAGKSHPKDDGGKRLIQDLWNFMHHEGAGHRMVFLEDYDMEVARHLVQGVDVWLNNPRRPMEASGTSGMKVVPNGGLNLSILDGWWAEGYDPDFGWAIGDDSELSDTNHQDWLDSRSLYQLIEQEVAPAFYTRGENGLPNNWIAMVKGSMKALAPYFSTSRMVREYTARFYMPSSQNYRQLSENKQARAVAAISWRDRVRASWKSVKVAKASDNAGSISALGNGFEVNAHVELGDLQPSDVRVQILVGTATANRELSNIEVHDMELAQPEGSGFLFRKQLTCDHVGQMGYILRVVPHNDDVSVIHEIPLVSWQVV